MTTPARETRLYHRLQIAAHRLQKAADRAVATAADLTTAQSAVLAVVATGGRVTQKSVAAQLGLNESAIAAMTQRLMAQSLLDRTRDGEDARVWLLSLTDEGRAQLKRIERPFRGINSKIEETLTPTEIARLADYLTRLAAAFGAPEE